MCCKSKYLTLIELTALSKRRSIKTGFSWARKNVEYKISSFVSKCQFWQTFIKKKLF